MKDKILLVDDDAMVLAGLKRQLRNHFSIDTALSGEEALKQVQENGPYAVIVSDYMMPGMNGIEFLSYVKKSDPDTVRILKRRYFFLLKSKFSQTTREPTATTPPMLDISNPSM